MNHPSTPRVSQSILALHHDYRIPGGEERAAEQLAALAEQELGATVHWLRRSSRELSGGAAARGLLRGGTEPSQVADAVAAHGAQIVHAHNLFPTFGGAALRAAQRAGAATVLHLHNTRLICAVATNVRAGKDCTACHAGWPLPGIQHRCRGGLLESAAYGLALPRWQRQVIDAADVVIVPSRAAATRLRSLGLTLPEGRLHIVGGVAPEIASTSHARDGRYALITSRLAPEKDLRTAIDACRLAQLPLVIAGSGPERAALEEHAGPPQPGLAEELLSGDLLADLPEPAVARGGVVFVGQQSAEQLARLRAGARVAICSSLAHETFGLAALEAMASAIPTVASGVGALPELVGGSATVPPGDSRALADRLRALAGDAAAGVRAADRARHIAAPAVVAEALGAAYAEATSRAAARAGA